MIIGVAGPVDVKLLDCDFGGATIPQTVSFPLTTHFTNALIKRGYRVIVYTNSGEITEPVVLQSEQVTVCIGCTRPQPGRRFFIYERNQLQALMQQYPSDVIYAFWTYEYAWAALRSGIPTIVSIHDIARKILLNQPDMFRLVRYLMNAIVMKNAKWLVANSTYTYSQLSAQNKNKATVINNFYSPHLEELVPHNIQKENFIVSIVMGFTKRKGIPRALHAFAKIRKKYPTLEYRLIGSGMEAGGPAQQYAKKHNLEDGVKFIGSLPHSEIIPMVARAKVLLHPSVEESFGMAVLEAMIAGTPVVGGKKSGFIPYLLNHGDVGVLCDITSEMEMANGVEQLLEDVALAEQIASKAYTYAEENFSEEVVMRQHIKLFHSILDIAPSLLSEAIPQEKEKTLKT